MTQAAAVWWGSTLMTKKTMKVNSDCSNNATSVTGDIELYRLAAPRGRRHSSGADIATKFTVVLCFSQFKVAGDDGPIFGVINVRLRGQRW